MNERYRTPRESADSSGPGDDGANSNAEDIRERLASLTSSLDKVLSRNPEEFLRQNRQQSGE